VRPPPSSYASHGLIGAGRALLHGLLSEYLAVERLFGADDARRPDDILADLRAAAGASAEAQSGVFDTMRAHVQLRQRNALVLAVLRRVAEVSE
jgi:hypothetical protein